LSDFNFVLSLFAPTSAKTTNDPGVKTATAIAADIFNLLPEEDGGGLVTGYLSAPHDWHNGVSCCSVASQNEQFGIDSTLIKYRKLLKYSAVQ